MCFRSHVCLWSLGAASSECYNIDDRILPYCSSGLWCLPPSLVFPRAFPRLFFYVASMGLKLLCCAVSCRVVFVAVANVHRGSLNCHVALFPPVAALQPPFVSVAETPIFPRAFRVVISVFLRCRHRQPQLQPLPPESGVSLSSYLPYSQVTLVLILPPRLRLVSCFAVRIRDVAFWRWRSCSSHAAGGRWTLDWKGMEAAMKEHPETALLMLCNPYNPVGEMR